MNKKSIATRVAVLGVLATTVLIGGPIAPAMADIGGCIGNTVPGMSWKRPGTQGCTYPGNVTSNGYIAFGAIEFAPGEPPTNYIPEAGGYIYPGIPGNNISTIPGVAPPGAWYQPPNPYDGGGYGYGGSPYDPGIPGQYGH